MPLPKFSSRNFNKLKSRQPFAPRAKEAGPDRQKEERRPSPFDQKGCPKGDCARAPKGRVPIWLEPFLPSFDISKMDLKDSYDKKLIIEAILNRGTMKEIKWLFKAYSVREIKNVLRNPRRGCWDARVLNYWTKIFGIKMHPIVYEMAILNLNPQPEKWEKWFKFIKRRASKETKKRWRELGLLKAQK